ncbi:hypothetical protein EU537_03705 [Candidatus Thorarchaeota archaeon]|nr:MAG: hypothetical protein EU537_03705 [Candidatus Thorarchaeota archaeon]
MTVRFIIRGPISKRLGSNSLKVEIQKDSTLEMALAHLIGSNAEVAKEWNTPESINREALVLINEQDVEILNGLDTALNSNDEIVILPLIHGG